MGKVVLFPVLLIAACVIAGLYGALHDQISYTVSPDYYHGFKFHQFDIPEHLQGRVGAAIVGWYASWWMGILIGIPVLIVGLILPGWRSYLKHCLIAFVVVAGTALLIGLGALTYASFAISESAFARAGTMHNFSYLGGFLGIITGSVYLVIIRAHQPGRGVPAHRSA
jgi:MFS family permease